MSDAVTNFNEYRSRMNDKLLEGASMTLKRIFSLDNQAYKAGSLDVATKELLGFKVMDAPSRSLSFIRLRYSLKFVTASDIFKGFILISNHNSRN